MDPLRWHSWQRACNIGATSLVKVTGRGLSTSAASKAPDNATNAIPQDRNAALDIAATSSTGQQFTHAGPGCQTPPTNVKRIPGTATETEYQHHGQDG